MYLPVFLCSHWAVSLSEQVFEYSSACLRASNSSFTGSKYSGSCDCLKPKGIVLALFLIFIGSIYFFTLALSLFSAVSFNFFSFLFFVLGPSSLNGLYP